MQFSVSRRGLPGAASLRRWARAAAASMPVTVRIVGTSEARRLNSNYRSRNRATNVLSFAYGDGTGDLVLCHPLIAREAHAQRKPLAAHYAHLVVHGLLHLRGYDHETRQHATRMERVETRVLRRLGFADPYAVR